MIGKIQDALKKYNKKVWIMYNKEDSDKYFCKYISKRLFSDTICVISQSETYILIRDLDKNNTDNLNYDKNKIHIITYSMEEDLTLIIEDIIAKFAFPEEICLSYSTMADKNMDILSHGQYLHITRLFKVPYSKYHKKVTFSSAEKIIYEIESPKTSLELSRLKYIANITEIILKETFNNIKVGMSEIEIANLTHNITDKIMKEYIGKDDIQSYGYSWKEDMCPIVLTGINLAKGGHSYPSNKKLSKGDTIYFDFGLKIKFKDNMVLYTDMQRMGYTLKSKESTPPKKIMDVFNTLVKSISEAIEEMRPGVKGYKVDKIVRSYIAKANYPDYNHSTGHPVGREVHDTGCIISIKTSKRANLELIENGVYTIEPRIQISNGGSIEEMVQVTKFGGVPLSPVQNEIYLVK